MEGSLQRLRFLVALSDVRLTARRYFVTNGFDGALTLLGLIMGFYSAGEVAIEVVISACTGTGVALGVSGVTSAYISETAERRRALRELEHAMVSDLSASDHGRAHRLAPLLIAAVNGFAPVVMALLVIAPLWLHRKGVDLIPFLPPLLVAAGSAFACVFLLGIFIGRISGKFWLWAGLRTVLIALVTSLFILLLTA